jgi:precorrin-2 dehydrogenase/sirohydrochlorin ferrochelatase
VPELCDFFDPAILRQGALTLSVATNGAAPALASALRDDLAPQLDGYATLLELFAEVRNEIKERCATFPERQQVWARIVAGREELRRLVRSGELEAARRQVRACIS